MVHLLAFLMIVSDTIHRLTKLLMAVLELMEIQYFQVQLLTVQYPYGRPVQMGHTSTDIGPSQIRCSLDSPKRVKMQGSAEIAVLM